MRLIAVLLLPILVLPAHHAYTQCRADSVITYRVLGESNQVASIEYFTFDEKDSLVKKTLVEVSDGKAHPVNEIAVRYYKSGPTNCTEYESRNWVPDRGIYRPESRHTQIRNKKGQLLAEKYDRTGTIVVAESESNYAYNKSGQLISGEFKSWNAQTNSWEPKSKVIYSYAGNVQTESITYVWDTLRQEWKNDWKLIFAYDSLNELHETVSYQFKNGAWVPKARTTYGTEPDKPVKWNIVQEWNGSRENWVNQHYYLFHLDEKGLTQKEIHLDWMDKEWHIRATFNYVYNEAGMLVQILNESNQVIVDRFCRE